MNTSGKNLTAQPEEKFIPNGAIAFFVLLIILCLAIWFGLYYIMLSRS